MSEPHPSLIPFKDWKRVTDLLPLVRIMAWELIDNGPDKQPTKKPVTTHGMKDATRDPDTLKGWAGKYRDAYVGIVSIAAGVIDCDLKDGTLPGLFKARELAPGAPEGESLSGGRHLWVAVTHDDKDLHCNRPASKMAEGIEWRGPETGFIALTESDLTALCGEAQPQPATPALRAMVTGQEVPAAGSAAGGVNGESAPAPSPVPEEQHRDRGAVTLTRRGVEELRGAGEGSREPALNDLAFLCGRLRGAGRMPDELLAEVMQGAEAACRENGALEKYPEGWLDEKFRRGIADGSRSPLHTRAKQQIAEQEPAGDRTVIFAPWLEEATAALPHIGWDLRWNRRAGQIDARFGDGDWVPFSDRLRDLLRKDVHRTCAVKVQGSDPPVSKPLKISKLRWDESVNVHVATREVDPVLDWLQNCKDSPGVPEIKDVPGLLWHIENPELAGHMLERWMVGLCVRTLLPGSKMDATLTLALEKGTGKSTFLEELLPNHWAISGLNLGLDEQAWWERARGCAIAILSEMSGGSRAEVSRLKDMLTDRSVSLRLPYGRTKEVIIAAWVFAATTNEIESIPRDRSGALLRRFWVIPILGTKFETEKDNVAELMKHQVHAWREGLWAQAMALAMSGELPILDRSQQAQANEIAGEHSWHDDALIDDTDRVAEVIERYPNGVSLSDAFVQVPGTDFTPNSQQGKRIASELRSRGFKVKRVRIDSTQRSHWFSPSVHRVHRSAPSTTENVKVQIEANMGINGENSGMGGNVAHGAHGAQQQGDENLAEAMAELECRQCGRATLPSDSGLCVVCEMAPKPA